MDDLDLEFGWFGPRFLLQPQRITGFIQKMTKYRVSFQSFGDSGIQGFRDSGIQRFGDSGIQGFRDPGIQGFGDSGIQIRGFRDSRIGI